MNSASEVTTLVKTADSTGGLTRLVGTGACRSFVFALSVCCSTGCGFISTQVSPDAAQNSNRAPVTLVSHLELAAEPPVFRSAKAPQQMAAQAKRELPRPDFGITPEVQRELDRFVTRDRATVLEVLERRSSRIDMLEKVFEGEGVPTELISVAAVESKFNPHAQSPAGARGMWQFMRSTAQIYGLKVSSAQDDRLDPVRSTIAAARHLRDLFLSYNDWHLALAAYNAGIGRVNRALSSHGESDFWALARSGGLSGETTRFVPKVIALTMIVNDPDRYGFEMSKMVG